MDIDEDLPKYDTIQIVNSFIKDDNSEGPTP